MRKQAKLNKAFIEAYSPEVQEMIDGDDPDWDRFKEEFTRQIRESVIDG